MPRYYCCYCDTYLAHDSPSVRKQPNAGYKHKHKHNVLPCYQQSLSDPPYFDGNDYTYWKIRMRAFLKSLDYNVWISIEKGWTKSNASIDVWSKDDRNECSWNSKGLNAIFKAVVSPNEFKLISLCEIAKEAWEILEVTYEDTQFLKQSKLQILASKFEEIKMSDDETFDDFYASLNNIVYSSLNLGKKISNNKIVRKIMRSLPEKFRDKVTVIEVCQDLDTIKVEELVGSLKAYELTFLRPKKKNLALKTVRKEASDSSDVETTDEENLEMLAKRFKRFLNHYQKVESRRLPKSGENFEEDSPQEKRNFKGKKGKNGQGFRCHECSGFGHIRVQCPNYQRSKGKSMKVTLSDESSNDSD